MGTQGVAQGTRQHYLHFGPGWSYNNTRDEAVSPLRYKGGGPALAIGYERETAERSGEVWLQGQYGRITPRQTDLFSAAMLLARADIGYRQLYLAGNFPDKRYSIFLGGGFLTTAVYREHNLFTNNAYQYDYAASISLEACVKRAIPVKQRTLSLDWKLSLPFLSALLRPGYNSSIPEGFIYYPEKPAKAVLASAEPGIFASYWRVLSTVGATYHLHNGNRIRLGYSWDTYRYSNGNRLTSATHTVYFLLLFNLSKKP